MNSTENVPDVVSTMTCKIDSLDVAFDNAWKLLNGYGVSLNESALAKAGSAQEFDALCSSVERLAAEDRDLDMLRLDVAQRSCNSLRMFVIYRRIAMPEQRDSSYSFSSTPLTSERIASLPAEESISLFGVAPILGRFDDFSKLYSAINSDFDTLVVC